jgi:hypothetical protein
MAAPSNSNGLRQSSQTVDLTDVVGGRAYQQHTLPLSATDSQSNNNYGSTSRQQHVMTPKTRRKLQQLANQLNVQVEEIEKAPYEILDNTDDVSEPMPAAIKIKPSKTQRENQEGIRRSQDYLASDVVSNKFPQQQQMQRKA